MRKVLFITDSKAAFPSVHLLQDSIKKVLNGVTELTTLTAGKLGVEDYEKLLPTQEIVFGSDANFFLARKKLGRFLPLILPSYGLGTRGLLPLWEWRNSLGQGDSFICPSTTDLAAAAVHLQDEQIRLFHVPYAIPDNYFDKTARVNVEQTLSKLEVKVNCYKMWLLYSGRLNRQKNVHLVLRIVRELTHRGFSVGLLLAGAVDKAGFPELGWDNEGYENELRDLVTELKLNERVYFLGNLDRQTMFQLYHCVDIHLTCSTFRTEDFGFAPIEAMACAVPTVSTAWGGFYDTVQDGLTGYRMPVKLTPTGLKVNWKMGADYIARILTNEQERNFLRTCCRAYARTNFTQSLFQIRLLRVIDDLLKTSPTIFRPLKLESLIDEETQKFFHAIKKKMANGQSLLEARQGLFLDNDLSRVRIFWHTYINGVPHKNFLTP
jgi:glycosyltransferase involved in cell wall biosynthesis